MQGRGDGYGVAGEAGRYDFFKTISYRGFGIIMDKVVTLHVPYKKNLILSSLEDPDFKVQTMASPGKLD